MSFQQFWTNVQSYADIAGWKIVNVLAIIVVGIALSKIIISIVKMLLMKSSIDNTLCGFIVSVVKFALILVIFVISATTLNIPSSTLVAIVGAAGLAIGLALQGALSNLANGVMIIGTHPFNEGDYVDIGGVAGSVKTIKIMTTEIITPDNKKIIIPNSKVTSSIITNFNARSTRRLDLTIAACYYSDIEQVKALIMNVIDGEEKIIKTQAPIVRLMQMSTNSLDFCVRVWVPTSDYWAIYWNLNEKIFKVFRENELSMPFNQLAIHVNDKQKTLTNVEITSTEVKK